MTGQFERLFEILQQASVDLFGPAFNGDYTNLSRPELGEMLNACEPDDPAAQLIEELLYDIIRRERFGDNQQRIVSKRWN